MLSSYKNNSIDEIRINFRNKSFIKLDNIFPEGGEPVYHEAPDFLSADLSINLHNLYDFIQENDISNAKIQINNVGKEEYKKMNLFEKIDSSQQLVFSHDLILGDFFEELGTEDNTNLEGSIMPISNRLTIRSNVYIDYMNVNLLAFFKKISDETFTNSKNDLLNDNYLNQLHKQLQQLPKAVNRSINSFSRVNYLSTIRGKNRAWYLDEQNDEISKLVQKYRKIDDEVILSFVEFWISKGKIDDNSLKGFDIGDKLEVLRDDSIGLSKLFLTKNNNKTSVVDLGYGFSQLLYIIIKIAVIASKNLTTYSEYGYIISRHYSPTSLIIEEPESNLHPKYQSKLAELFLDAATRFNIQFILETHSEYLIYKFQEYIGKQIINPNDVALYYLNHPDSDKKYVNRVPIKEDGSIEYEKYFGIGFFDEQTNLKLSLLNIQRDSFLKLFQKTKEKFSEDDTLSDEEQLEQLNNLIDGHFEKLDFSTHIGFVKTQFPNHGKLLPKSINYLASGYHLFTIIDDNNQITDYSPAVLQFGRAVENEIYTFFKKVKDSILTNPNHNTWISNYTKNNDGQHLTILTNDGKIKAEFKTYIKKDKNNEKGKKYEISFGNMRQVFEQLNQEPLATIQNVGLLNALYVLLTTQYFNNWSNINALIPTLANIVDLRNKSTHTYANPISRTDAFDYKVEVENWLRVWSDERR